MNIVETKQKRKNQKVEVCRFEIECVNQNQIKPRLRTIYNDDIQKNILRSCSRAVNIIISEGSGHINTNSFTNKETNINTNNFINNYTTNNNNTNNNTTTQPPTPTPTPTP